MIHFYISKRVARSVRLSFLVLITLFIRTEFSIYDAANMLENSGRPRPVRRSSHTDAAPYNENLVTAEKYKLCSSLPI